MKVLWSVGLQSRRGMIFGKNPDMDAIAEMARKNKIQDVIIFGKDNCGYCFHPTKIGYPLRDLTHDLTGELAEALHKRGIGAIGYVNFGMDGEAGRHHREWLMESEPGVPSRLTEDTWADLCPFSGYLEQYLLPVTMEMLKRYHLDGIFFDTMYAFNYCACASCRRQFKKETGLDLPPSDWNQAPEIWAEYAPWQYRRIWNCMDAVRRKIRAEFPNAEIFFNHRGHAFCNLHLPGVLEEKISADPSAYYPYLSLFANYGSSLPAGSEIFIERFIRGWGDRNACSDASMRYKAASIFAHRQDFRVGDRLHHDWRPAAGSDHALEVICKTLKIFQKELPDRLVKRPNDLLLVPESYIMGFRKTVFRSGSKRIAAKILSGACRMLIDCGRNFLMMPEMTAADHLKPDRLLILAGCEYLNRETETSIREFIRNGGRVLLTGTVPLQDNGKPVEWSGIRTILNPTEKNCKPALYLPDVGSCKRKPDGERPMLLSDMAKVTLLRETEKILPAYHQEYRDLFIDSSFAYYLSSAPSPAKEPLLTCFRYGKGKVFFLNCSIFSDYYDGALPVIREWMGNLLKKIFPGPETELVSPAGDVEYIVYDDPKGGSVHLLLNHGGRRSGYQYAGSFGEQVMEPQPAYPVTLKIRSKSQLRISMDGKETVFSPKGGIIEIPVVMNTMWKFLQVKPV